MNPGARARGPTAAIAAVLAAAVLTGACQSAASGSAGGSSGGSSGGVSQPAAAKGSCTVVHPVIVNEGGRVAATVDWSCNGAAVMTLRLRLAFDGNNASRDDLGVEEGDPVTVNYPLDFPPARLSAPCQTSGYWRVNMVGKVDDLGSVIVLKSGTAPFNTPSWMVPVYVHC